MAAPIGHIYLALQMLTGPLNGVDEQAFIIGNLFPDIRYSAHLAREATHKTHVTWTEIISEKDPFTQGVLFHAFVDERRDEYMKKHNLHNLLPKLPYAHQCLKIIEDLHLNPKLQNKSFLRHFDIILPQEKTFTSRINDTTLQNWHTTLQNYFFYGPTPQTIRPLIRYSLPDLGKFTTIAEIGSSYVFKLETDVISLDQTLTTTMLNFYDQFETLFIQNVALSD